MELTVLSGGRTRRYPPWWRPFARRRAREAAERMRSIERTMRWEEWCRQQAERDRTSWPLGTYTQGGYAGGMDPELREFLGRLP